MRNILIGIIILIQENRNKKKSHQNQVGLSPHAQRTIISILILCRYFLILGKTASSPITAAIKLLLSKIKFHKEGSIETLPNLHNKTRNQMRKIFKKRGFKRKDKGTYENWRHPDGGEVSIRPEAGAAGPKGEIVRHRRVKIDPNNTSRCAPKKTQRFDQTGKPTKSHNTGEIVVGD